MHQYHGTHQVALAPTSQPIKATKAPPGTYPWLVVAMLAAAVSICWLLLQYPDHQLWQAASVLGIIGMWRYGWGALHWLRSALYQELVFPVLRQRADIALQRTSTLSPINCVVMAYQTPHDIFAATFYRLFREAAAAPMPIGIYAAVTNEAEQEWLETALRRYCPGGDVQLTTLVQHGYGKRPALADTLRAVRAAQPNTVPDNALTMLMDGDTILPAGIFKKVAGFFYADAKLGAVTMNNQAHVNGSWLLQQWYDLRHKQRHWLMGSMSLSKKLLVLTGRCSVFRTKLTTDPTFIRQVEHDVLHHWRFGNIPLVTGEDKSTWFWLLKRGWQMRYLPDILTTSVEECTDKTFVGHTIPLARRWYGNMLRSGSRALKLGPKTTGGFTWWCLADQFCSPWTTLTGPIATLLLFLKGWWLAVPLYILWVLVTRTVYSWLLTGKSWQPTYPFILYYSQITGAAMKVKLFFRPHLQGWTGQKLPAMASLRLQLPRWQEQLSTAFHVSTMVIFVYSLGLAIGY